MIVKLLTDNNLEFLSLIRRLQRLVESTLVKMSNCWKSHAAAQYQFCHISFPAGLIIPRRKKNGFLPTFPIFFQVVI